MNNTENWMPRHPVIVMDRDKMSYFSRATAIRAGVTGTRGALTLSGFGDPDMSDISRDFSFDPTTISGTQKAGGNTLAASSSQSVDSFLDRLSHAINGPKPTPSDDPTGPFKEIPFWQTGLGIFAVGVAGVVAWRYLRK